tara:strand:- start:4545 stop:4922 length:378 start_codon:yes stop_codon:yes gene_type:complete
MYHAWIHRLAEAGIVTYFTTHWAETARLLVAIYRNEQKPPEEHSTLQRIIKPRIAIKEHSNFVKALVYISHTYKIGIGEEKAKALSTKFSSILDIAMADIDELCECAGVGKTIAKKLLSAIGREE